MSGRQGNRRWALLAVAILAVAFLLRTHRFTELPPGLFFDEAYNILDGLAVLDGGQRPMFFAGNNGREPFFIYLQALFVLLGGTEPFAIRLPSVFLGTLTVALTYPLVRRLLAAEEPGRREAIAILAMFLMATMQWHLNFSRVGFRAIAQPFFEALVVYLLYRGGQELAGTVDRRVPIAGGAQSTVAERCLAERRAHEREAGDGRFWWLWLALAGIALGLSLYTYLSARLLPPGIFALVVVALVWGQRITRRYLAGLLVLALAWAASSAPLAWYYYRHPDTFIGHSKDVSLLNFGGLNLLAENALRLAGMFNWAGDVNWRHNLPGRPVFDLLVGLFFLAGIVLVIWRLGRGWRRRSAGPNGYLAPAVLVPVMLLPSLLSESAPHFLRAIGVLPFLAIFPAVGIEAGWRWLRERTVGAPDSATTWGRPSRRHLPAVALSVVLVFTTAAAYKGYFLDWGGREDPYYHFDGRYFEFAGYVKAQAAQHRIYLSPWLANHATARLLLRDTPYAAFDSERTVVLSAKDALYGFEEAGVDREAAAAFPKRLALPLQEEHVPDRYGRPAFGFYRLPATSSPAAGDAPTAASSLLGPLAQPANVPADATLSFGDDLLLLGLAIGPQPDGTEGDDAITPGVTLPVTLVWRAAGPVADDYTVSLRLSDSSGRRWAQLDTLAGGSSYPTSRWQHDEIVVDRPPFTPPADLPPGEYRLEAAVYSLAHKTTSEVVVAGQAHGELATLGVLRVARPSPGALAAMRPPNALAAAFGQQLTLLGYGLSRDAAKPGEALEVDLFWKAEQDVDRELAVAIALVDSRGQSVAEWRGPPLNGSYPTSRWRAGDALRDIHRLTIAAKAAPGPSSLRVALVDAAGAVVGEVELAGLAIAERERLFAAPAPPFARPAQFADKIALLGFAAGEGVAAQGGDELPRLLVDAGAVLPITLGWRALIEMETSYTVFVQLLSSEGKVVAQHDGLPQAGAAPTSSWLAQEVVADRHDLSLRPDLPPGDYTLIAGLYNALDGKRMPAGQQDFVRLATVAIAGR